MVFTFLENALNLSIFTHAPLPTQNFPPNSYHHTLGRRKLLISPGSIFWKIYFRQQQKTVATERSAGNHDLLYQNLIKKYVDDLEH